ncbi:SMR domain-containing protein At5g58720-like [Camellia sinensis]|uniref:SMR domain-containing protein At5g58720-like n=1 Tax=Camellia sinensis TaxID=4442 RepID=UPI001035D802|nr:SMR domain-containing protein At5g58720-like [Camellia sinensis]
MKHSKKKKRSRPTNQVGVKGAAREGQSEERRVVKSLMESFTSVSIEEASSAYREANGDPSKAAEILGELLEIADDQATSCSGSSSSLGPSSAEVFMDANCGGSGVRGRGFRGTNKQKKVIASTGTVSTILGKEYVRSSPRKDSYKPLKGYAYGPANKGDAEQFLCSMLGDDCELSMAVVRDVLCCYLSVGDGASSKDVMPMLEIQNLVAGDNVVSKPSVFSDFGGGVSGECFLH